jgi:NAD(P)H-dependent FMN reductase
MLRLQIIIASTRPIRAGKPVGDWFTALAAADGRFEVEQLDLKAIDLPFLNEPRQPAQGDYQMAHTKAWSAIVDRGDAYVLVTCEYNHGYPAPLKNALDTLAREWAGKPFGFVSYGGIAGGTRAVQQLKQVLIALGGVPLAGGVIVPIIARQVDEARTVFTPNENNERAAKALLDDLADWGTVLKARRQAKG